MNRQRQNWMSPEYAGREAYLRSQQIGGYSGPVDCILADSTSLRLDAQLRTESNGAGMVGALNIGNFTHLFKGGDAVTLRLINTLPAGMERKFVVSGVVTTSRAAFAQVGSVGGWF